MCVYSHRAEIEERLGSGGTKRTEVEGRAGSGGTKRTSSAGSRAGKAGEMLNVWWLDLIKKLESV